MCTDRGTVPLHPDEMRSDELLPDMPLPLEEDPLVADNLAAFTADEEAILRVRRAANESAAAQKKRGLLIGAAYDIAGANQANGAYYLKTESL